MVDLEAMRAALRAGKYNAAPESESNESESDKANVGFRHVEMCSVESFMDFDKERGEVPLRLQAEIIYAGNKAKIIMDCRIRVAGEYAYREVSRATYAGHKIKKFLRRWEALHAGQQAAAAISIIADLHPSVALRVDELGLEIPFKPFAIPFSKVERSALTLEIGAKHIRTMVIVLNKCARSYASTDFDEPNSALLPIKERTDLLRAGKKFNASLEKLGDTIGKAIVKLEKDLPVGPKK